MVMEIIYNSLLLSSVYIGFDLINKYKTQEITTNDDIKMYFVFKGMKMLNMVNYTKRTITNFINSCSSNDEKEEEIDENIYKIVIIKKDNNIAKCLLCYEEDDYYFEDDECNIDNILKNDETKLIFITKTAVRENEKFLQLQPTDLKENILDLKKKLKNINNKKLFLNIQLSINDEEYDLNKIVNKYCVSGNNILSLDFLRYILQDYFEIELENEEYKINIIDKNVVMFEINKNNNIQITDDGYKII